ncbi:dephospho-CoA kinase [Brumimicrobium salinarum]|uniref:Dephospho-CoA kinase n=1 Tax=Brumimicrobium salinarum TaxID=2058658 RepID=A0A2I0R2P9_9FLAO|nr:dephospho-CoA kinase [Brumimicrobium salinarum]PKR80864.1 dephospho-CoA kinase [Brumimicrobium salinarum]
MLKIGLTGGIGSGKSIIGKVLTIMGYPVFNSDDNAKLLMTESNDVKNEIKNVFGEEAYIDNQLNRSFLANKIFKNSAYKEQLNAIVHPAVRKAFHKWSKEQDASIIFNEAAILFETGRYTDFDYTILVTAPEEVRINRVIIRDGSNVQAVKDRINNQWPDEKKADLASYIITNDDSSLVTQQIEVILAEVKRADNQRKHN